MIKAYFNDIEIKILEEISVAKKSLKIAVAWFTNNKLFDELIVKCKSQISVELIIIKDSINIRQFGLDFNQFIKEGGTLYFGNTDNLMHHKFCIIDDNVVINGSYNWTYWAETKNKENITIFEDEYDILQSFDNEFKKLIFTKNPIQIIDPELQVREFDNTSLYNINNMIVSEYLSSAIDLGNRGFQEMANKIFEEVIKINPVKASNFLQDGVASNNQIFKRIYQNISTNCSNHSTETNYENYCNNICNYINNNNYINAITLANSCIEKFPGKFSVHVYCGDAKKKLNDNEGANLQYRTALMNLNNSNNTNLIYYNISYNYTFFPKADIYLKMGEVQKAIEILKEAFRVYKQMNVIAGITKSENYLNQIYNNKIPLRIQ